MADQESEHSWKCFKWDLADKEEGHLPCTSRHHVTLYASSNADCAELVIDEADKKQLIQDGDEFAAVIKNICKASERIGRARDIIDTLNLDKHSEGNRKPLATLIAARSDLWLALGALIAAQKSPTTIHVDEQSIALTGKWRNAIWDRIVESNANFARNDELESPMLREERWVGFWPLGSGSFGTTVCERRMQRELISSFERLC